MSNNKVQITTASSYNANNIIFQEPVLCNIPGSTIPYQRVNIKMKYPDGKIGDLIIPTETLFSFGVSEVTTPGTATVTGYTLSLALYNRDGVSEAEKKWVQTFRQIEEQCKKYVIENRVKLGKKGLEMAELKKFSSSSFYWKVDDNDNLAPSGPTLNPKLIISKKDGKDVIKSDFYDLESGESINAMMLIKKYCYARAAIKIESIYIGSKIALQVKLWEVGVSLLDKGVQRLLVPDASKPSMEEVTFQDSPSTPVEVDVGSINNSESESESEEEPVPVMKTTKKMVSRKK
jgi:hypothetical protein